MSVLAGWPPSSSARTATIYGRADDRTLRHHSGMTLAGYFARTAIDTLVERLDVLSPGDRDR